MRSRPPGGRTIQAVCSTTTTTQLATPTADHLAQIFPVTLGALRVLHQALDLCRALARARERAECELVRARESHAMQPLWWVIPGIPANGTTSC